MISIEDVFNEKKVKELNNLIKMFELSIRDRRKAETIRILSEYLSENVEKVIRKFIIYDELMILKSLCDNNYEMILEDAAVDTNIQSLTVLGLVYVYNKDEKKHVCIPLELQNNIESCLDDSCIIEFSKCRKRVIKMFHNLLELYGAFNLTVLEDYIINEIGDGYRIHRSIEFIRMYNERNHIYNIDENMVYYNSKITDIENVKTKLYNMYTQYRYYENDNIEYIINKKSSYENNIYIILNRVYKNSKDAVRVMEEVNFMVRQGKETEEIGAYVKEQAKRISAFGLRNICKSVDMMREDTIIWGLKGYTLGEAQIINKNTHNCVKAI